MWSKNRAQQIAKHSGVFVRVLGAMRFGVRSGWAESHFFLSQQSFCGFLRQNMSLNFPFFVRFSAVRADRETVGFPDV